MNLRKIYPKRPNWSHKGQFGRVLIVAGSKKYSGSPIFNAVSALRSGADLVTTIGHKRAMDIAATYLPDIITYPLDNELTIKHLPQILKLAKDFDSLVIGCGLSRSAVTYQAIKQIIRKVNLPMIIDAEAIRALAAAPELLKNKPVVITPHAEEFRILTGVSVKPNLNDRKEKVKLWAKKLKTVILLKGFVDVISDGQSVILNDSGSPFMTKGGFGDTLSGIGGTLLARGLKSLTAAQAAAYINGRAGELACKKYGEGTLASDIFEFIPQAIKKLSIN